MTHLTRPVTRAVVTPSGKQLVVTLTADGILLREKGRRIQYLLPYAAALTDAAERYVQLTRRNRGSRNA